MGSTASKTTMGLGAKTMVARLMLVVFLLRALIPQGFMPDFRAGGDGTFKLVICSASGFKSTTVDPETPHDNQKHQPADQPCAFAGLIQTALATVHVIAVE